MIELPIGLRGGTREVPEALRALPARGAHLLEPL